MKRTCQLTFGLFAATESKSCSVPGPASIFTLFNVEGVSRALGSGRNHFNPCARFSFNGEHHKIRNETKVKSIF